MLTWHEQSSSDVTEQICWPTVPLPWWNYVEPAPRFPCWISVASLLSGCKVHTGHVHPFYIKVAHRWDMKTLSLLPNFLRFYSLSRQSEDKIQFNSIQSNTRTGAIKTSIQHDMVGHTRHCFYDFWSIITSSCITRNKLAACHIFQRACHSGCMWDFDMHMCNIAVTSQQLEARCWV